jgi:hypothetical protein
VLKSCFFDAARGAAPGIFGSGPSDMMPEATGQPLGVENARRYEAPKPQQRTSYWFGGCTIRSQKRFSLRDFCTR